MILALPGNHTCKGDFQEHALQVQGGKCPQNRLNHGSLSHSMSPEICQGSGQGKSSNNSWLVASAEVRNRSILLDKGVINSSQEHLI